MNGIFTTLATLHGETAGDATPIYSIRDYLECHPRAAHFVECGEGILGVRNAPAMVKAAVGAALEEQWETVLLATECDLTDFRAAFQALAHRLHVETLPLCSGSVWPAMEEVDSMLKALGIAVSRQLPNRLPAVQPAWGCGTPEFGFVLAGPPVGLSNLMEQAARLGWTPLLSDWGLRCRHEGITTGAAITRFLEMSSPDTFLDQCRQADVLGLPLILRTEPFCGHQMTDVWLRHRWRGPMLVLEASRIGPLDASQNLRLESFLRMCREDPHHLGVVRG